MGWGNRQGRFRFDGVVDESLNVQVNAAHDRFAEKNVPAGSADVVLVLSSKKSPREVPADGE